MLVKPGEKSIKVLPFLAVLSAGAMTGFCASASIVCAVYHEMITTLVFGGTSGLAAAYFLVLTILSVEDPK